ncbi:MAG TPA: alpha-galactosidase [Bryobacteraceae bacterium]|nr:alpha-galactosidase [Bryobacteraceae bacterium]
MQLSSAETEVTLKAGPAAPYLSSLAGKGGNVWENRASEILIDHVEIDGSANAIEWRLRSAYSSNDRTHVRFVYEASSPHLRLFWEWRVRTSHGPIEHSIRIQNLSGKEIWLPLQDSLRFDFRVPPEQLLKYFWVEKGAGSPSAEGTHDVALRDGGEWTGTSSTYAHASKFKQGDVEPREIIPYLLVEHADPRESGWYAGIEFSGRTRITLKRRQESVAGELGLNPNPGRYRTRLLPGQAFETPIIFLGAFDNGPDGAGNILRRWIRETLNSRVTLRNPSYPMLVSNSWGSGMAINEQQARRMIQDASELGLEMFHLDAGWFRGVGDWASDPAKFPNGVGAVADYAHRIGLKFGLWTDWTQAGNSTESGALNVHDPKVRDWLAVDPPAGWRPEAFKGITIDIGVPAARQWAAATLSKLVSNYHLDMLEHDGYLVAQGCERQDHPHAPLDLATARRYKDEDFLWVEGPNDTDVSYYATRAYYDVQSSLRRQFPTLLFEICNDGGRMVDFGSAAHGDYFSITDAYDPLSNRRAFFDASYVFPPAMLETYVEKWPAPKLDNFRYMLRSGMMGWFSLMQDSTTWTREQRGAAREEFALYAHKLRPLIRDSDVYHVSERPDGVHWDGIEYFDSVARSGVLFAFRGSSQAEGRHIFRLRGLQKASTYKVNFHDGSSRDYRASGERLMRIGITVEKEAPNSSEIVFLDEIKS